MASRGGRVAHGERLRQRLIVRPDRARELLLRVVVGMVNESLTIESALARLAPFFVETEHDAALLRDELARLKTLSQIREARRVEYRTEEILRLTEGMKVY